MMASMQKPNFLPFLAENNMKGKQPSRIVVVHMGFLFFIYVPTTYLHSNPVYNEPG